MSQLARAHIRKPYEKTNAVGLVQRQPETGGGQRTSFQNPRCQPIRFAASFCRNTSMSSTPRTDDFHTVFLQTPCIVSRATYSRSGLTPYHWIRPQASHINVVADLFAQSRLKNDIPAVFNSAEPSSNSSCQQCSQIIRLPLAKYRAGGSPSVIAFETRFKPSQIPMCDFLG